MVELAHDIRGTGPLVVLLHGITEDRRSWDPLTNDLAYEHRVLRVDLRGHGGSPTGGSYELADYAADVADLVDEPPLIIGHSLGGTVATAFASAYETRGVVNVDQSLDLAGLQQQVQGAAPVLRSEAFPAAVGGLFDSMRGATPDDEWARLTGIRAPRQDVVLGTWSLLLDQDATTVAAAVGAMAGAVRAPYLSLFGIDPGPGYADWLTALVPQARVEVWDGLGHYPHLVRPAQFLDLVAEFEATLS